LEDLGVPAVITGYGGGGAGLVDLRAVPARAVTVAPGVVRAFAADTGESPFGRAIEYLVRMSAERDIEVIALGVDDPDVAGRLPALGVRIGAGTALGLPLSAADATALLAAERRN
jgi:EAL domain-containing protein (putative c-di-GMP-specific phosphodiesterase class I)